MVKKVWFAVPILVLGGTWLAAHPPEALDPSIPYVPRGGSLHREWPKAQAPDFSALKKRWQDEGRETRHATPVWGYGETTYQAGPYTVRIGEYYKPERVKLDIQRAWWPLW